MEEVKSESRVRMNISQNAKGVVQLDVTVEFPTVVEAAAALGKAIDEARLIVSGRGLKLASDVA